jgi:hypothetical protein
MPAVTFDVSSASTTALVAAPGAGRRVRVFGYRISADAAVKCTLKSGTTAREPIYATKAVGGGMIGTFSENGFWDCADNEALNLTTDASANVGGVLFYSIYPAATLPG